MTNVARNSVAPGETTDSKAPQPATLEEAFARFQGELLGMLFYMVGNREDAHDVLQETFVKCWRHREKLPQIENLRAWIFRIAVNTARDLRQTAWRRRRKPLPEGQTMIDKQQTGPDAHLHQNEQLSLVRRALAQLRPEEQEVFLLRQNGELTYDDIAQTIGIPTGTVKTRMRLALTKLRHSLADS